MANRVSLCILLNMLSCVAATSGFALDTVRIGLPAPGMASSAPLYAAKELGLFAAEGLDIDIAVFRGGSAAQEALVAGAADIINPALAGAAVAIGKGVKQKCVAGANGNENGWYLLVKSDSKISSPKDLNGQRIGISAKASNTDYFSLWTQKEAGIKADAIPLGTLSAQVGALKSEQVAAIPASPPESWQILQSGVARILTDYGKDMPPFYTGCWAAQVTMIEQKPNVIKAFFRGYLNGIAYMRDHRDYSINFLKHYADVSDPKLQETFYDQLILGPIIESTIRRSYVERSLELASLSGVKNLPEVDQIFTDQFFPISP